MIVSAPPGEGPLSLAEADALLGWHLRHPDESVVLAVSGGPDSVALMGFAARLRAIGRLARVVVATVDHGLRASSRAEAESVASWAGSLSLPHRLMTCSGPRPRARIQEWARTRRYELLGELAREVGASSILTAHTFDDQAETVLLRLFAGSGIGGLAAMDRQSDRDGIRILRPFLDVSKARLVRSCEAEGWTFVRDPSNEDGRFARTRIRALMPTLAAEGLSTKRLVRLARRARRADDALEDAARAAYARALLDERPDSVVLDRETLLEEPVETVVRVLAIAIVQLCGSGNPIRLVRLERLAESLGSAGEGDGWRATLAGALFSARDGRLAITLEPPRRAGHLRRGEVVASRRAHSLGKGGGDA